MPRFWRHEESDTVVRDSTVDNSTISTTSEAKNSIEKEFLLSETTETASEGIAVIPQWSRRVNGREFSKYQAISYHKPRRTLVFLPVLDPRSLLATIWAYVTTITDMTYTSFVVPLSLAFNDYSTLNAWTILDLIGSSIFVLDLFIEFHIGFMIRWDSESVIIMDGREVAKSYIKYGTFVIDFLASLPIIVQILLVSDPSFQSNGSLVKLLQLLRLLRLLRVIRLILRMGSVSQGGSMTYYLSTKFSTLTLFMMRIAFTLGVLLNLMACLWWWIAVTENYQNPDNNTWVSSVNSAKPDLDLYDTSNLARWLVCAYYILCTISTIGYGDITPVTYPEILLACIFILTGVAYFGYVISSISELLEMSKSSNADGSALLEKLRGMEDWMKKNGFRKSIKQELRRFYYTTWTPKNDESDIKYFEELPLWLRTKVLKSMIGNSEALEEFTGIKLHPLSKVAKRVVRAITATAVPLHYRAGEKIFRYGEDADYLYLLEEGEIGALLEGDDKPYRVMSPGVIGVSALFKDRIPACRTRAVTAFTVSSCSVWRIDAKDLYGRLLASAPISLLHILDSYVDSLHEFAEHWSDRGEDPVASFDAERMTEIYKDISSEAEHVKAFLRDASLVKYQRDVDRGTIAEDDVDHATYYNILHAEHGAQRTRHDRLSSEELEEGSRRESHLFPQAPIELSKDILQNVPLAKAFAPKSPRENDGNSPDANKTRRSLL